MQSTERDYEKLGIFVLGIALIGLVLTPILRLPREAGVYALVAEFVVMVVVLSKIVYEMAQTMCSGEC